MNPKHLCDKDQNFTQYFYLIMNKPNESPHKEETLAPTLPEDLIPEILNRLTPESVVKCTALCKSWNQIIRDPTFISKYLHTTLSSKDDSGVLMLSGERRGNTVMYHCSLCRNNNGELEECEVFDFPFCSEHSEFHVRGVCNGIVCLVDSCTRYGYNCILWSPSIRKYRKLPPPGLPTLLSIGRRFYDDIALGFDSSTGDFKVLRFWTREFYRKRYLLEVEVYSLNDGSWRTIVSAASSNGVRLKYRLKSRACCVNGCLHWIAFHPGKYSRGIAGNHFILVFDLTSEVFYNIALPPSTTSYHLWYIVALGASSLAVIEEEESQVNIWVMKEYGVVDSWTKLWSFDTSRSMPTIGDSLDVQQAYELLSKSSLFWSSPERTSVHKFIQSLALFDKGDDVSTYMETLKLYEENPSD